MRETGKQIAGTVIGVILGFIVIVAVMMLFGCGAASVGMQGVTATVSGGVTGTTKGADGTDINYDLHSSVNWTAPTPTPIPKKKR